jgi:hypothetical protein
MAWQAPQPTAHGAQRRIRALAARGWAPEAIERATGIPAPTSARLMNRRDMIRPADIAAASAYRQLWNRQPPQATAADQRTSSAAAEHAHLRGWAPPLAWDDELIDQPDARAAEGWKPGRGTAGTRRSADLAEDARFVRDSGGYRHASAAEVVMRLGVKPDRLQQALSRARAAQRDTELDREAG